MSDTPQLTNKELADAIAYAFDCCNLSYIGGYTTSETAPGKTMLEHLNKLLENRLTTA